MTTKKLPIALRCALGASLLLPCTAVLADTVFHVDARAALAVPPGAHLRMGSSRAPDGTQLQVNSRYLALDGKPWFPVMGEFHYTRSPPEQWEDELLKMKAAGITAVATYVIWNHHEEVVGAYDWTGRRDLRQFIELCHKAGLQAVVRLGPWVHAEVRHGGMPDWVIDAMPTRRNDAQYLGHVERWYGQIGQQLQGLLWKDGGPVMAVQLENEYNLTGAGMGAEHIATLKQLAIKAGLDVPFYTVTGWDGTQYPPGEVTPVFGGYVDEPWSIRKVELPPKETHAFRFDTRVSGDLGAQTAARRRGTADSEIDKVPFLGAEYGPGVPAMYRRRPLIAPDDIAAMIPVQLGSGVNLLGYYMFHGGRNPPGRTWLQESSATGSYNDLPLINYDFQAPLGPDGQQRPVLEALRPFHWFLQAYGSALATMTVRKPAQLPASAQDLQTLRYAVRSNGDSGYLYVNNHVRQYPMAEHRDVRFSVALPGGTLVLPSKPVTIANGDYFIWPLNLAMHGTTLRYATAQPVTRVEDKADNSVVYVFAAQSGMPVELAFDAADARYIEAGAATLRKQAGTLLATGITPGTGVALTVARPQAPRIKIVVLTMGQARQLTVAQLAGRQRLLLSGEQLFIKDGKLELRATASSSFRVGIFPALSGQPTAHAGTDIRLATGEDGIFQTLAARLPERRIDALVHPVRAALAAPKTVIGGPAGGPLPPLPEQFGAAAAWQVEIPRAQLQGLDDALLEIDFVGDIGRLYSGVQMLDDWYYNGQRWQYGLRQSQALLDRPLTVAVMPLRADTPVYLAREAWPDFAARTQVAELRAVRVLPVYRLTVTPAPLL